MLGDKRLGRRPVARVRNAAGRLLMGLIADVVGQLDLHRPLHQPFRLRLRLRLMVSVGRELSV